MNKLEEIDRMRSGYQEQAAKGLMTLDELSARLMELDLESSPTLAVTWN
jgi:hypothetical protein